MSENPYENFYKRQNETAPSDSERELNPVSDSAVNGAHPGPYPGQGNRQYNRFEDNMGYNARFANAPSSEENSAGAHTQHSQEFVTLDFSGGCANDSTKAETLPAYQTAKPMVNPDPAFSCEWRGDDTIAPVTDSYEPYNSADPTAHHKKENKKNKNKNKKTPVALILILCMIISMVFGGAGAFVVNEYLSDKNQVIIADGLNITQVNPDYYDSKKYAESGMTTADVVDRTADSVVEIVTETVQTGSFAQQYIQSGAGSGVIIDRDGYIVTNHHVIDGARKITVTLKNGESYDAELIGSDTKKDLALLKIEATNLTAAVFGDSDKLRVGQRTIAIGNPLGQLGGSVTEGILSALDRELAVDGQTMNLLQTDTAINPGNSGGGLFDANANLIGIVVAKSSGSEVEGLGFAVPVNDVVDVVSDLMQYGYVRGRVSVGMEFLDVTSIAMAWMYGLTDTGCYVYSVSGGSAAASSGIKSGDLVVAVDGKQVTNSEDIEAIIEGKTVGDEVEFTIKRSGQTGNITVILSEEIPDSVTPSASYDNSYEWYDFSNYDFESYN